MANIIRIKRSATAGNPSALGAGEIAYSSLLNTGFTGGVATGGQMLYIGTGTETSGNAVTHAVIGGEYFTAAITAATDVNTASTLVKRNASGNFSAGTITAALSGNASTATALATSRTIAFTGDATASGAFDGSASYSQALILATVNVTAAIGGTAYGSATAIPIVTVNSKGLVTGITTTPISTTINLAGQIGSGSISGGGTLTVTGGLGIGTSVTGSTVTIIATQGYTTTVTAAGTTTLTSASSAAQFFTGTNTQTVTLPAVATLLLGNQFIINNNSTNTVIVQSSGANNVISVIAGLQVTLTCIAITGTTALSWSYEYTGNAVITGSGALVLATSPSLTTPSFSSIINIGTITVPTTTGTLALLSNSTYVGTTAITLSRVSANQSLTGILDITLPGATSGSVQIIPTATAGTGTILTLPATTDTLVGKATADIFTNKTLDTAGTGNSFKINGSAITAYTGTAASAVVLATSPTLTTPVLGVASATSINKVTITAPATSSTLTIADGKTLSASNTLTFTGTDTSSVAFGVGGTVAYANATLAQFAATTSLQFAGVISDETGTGSLVTPILGAATATSITGVSGTILALAAAGTNINITLTPTGTGTVDVASKRITSVATPTADTDAANKLYVDSAIAGLTWKSGVNLLAVSNVPLTGTSGTVVIDGHAALTTAHVGYRLLLTNQTTATQAGVYSYADNGTTYTLTRATDADTNLRLRGAAVFVEEGTTYAKSSWVQGNTYLLADFSGQSWVQFNAASSYVGGAGLVLTGATFDVVGTANRITANADSIDIAATYVGQSSITTLGTIGSGTWNGGIIAGTYGGTGINNGVNTITLAGSITHAGAFSQTFTATAASSVTLPTTGTLATLSGAEAISNKSITISSISGSSGSFTTLASSSSTTFTSVTDATAIGAAAVVLSGGLGVAKSIFVGTNITGAGPTISTIDGFSIDGGTY
jgi:hypothetical protein